MNKIITKEIDLNGRKLKLETGKLALQADASCVVSWGETVLLVTVTTKPLTEDIGYFPLSLEFVEKHYAGGRISSSRFIKRETRPSDEAVLSGRVIDRSIRPLFPKDFKQEVQVIITVLSIDQANDPDIVGLIGTSAALSISSIPWNGPIAAVRVGEKDGQMVVNPTISEMEHLNMDLLVASNKDKVVMIETEAKEVLDSVILTGIKEAHQAAQTIINLISQFAKEAGKEKQTYSHLAEEVEEALLKEVSKKIRDRIEKALFDNEHPWHEATGNRIKEELALQYVETLTSIIISGIFDKVAKEIMYEVVLGKGQRVDGRGMNEIRPLQMEVSVLPRTHGSALFQRGDTQVLSVATLGAPSLQQTLEGMEGETQKRFMHHYNMGINPFSVGEVKKLGPPNRRDIGHGSLVEKSLNAVIPTEDQFPYAIRVVSEVLAANASTSMASVCSTTLALLNAGVPLSQPVAGIALGLFSDPSASRSTLRDEPSGSDSKSSGQVRYQVITDMRAVEDFYGEMDFKVAGTKNGVTAIQMDTKLEGLSFEVIEEALSLGKKARLEVLEEINKVAPSAGPLSPHAPRVEILHIKSENIGLLIGPGGKNINGIIAKTGAQIDIEDDGTVMVSGTKSEGVDQAIAAIEGMFKNVNVGDEFMGKVVRLVPFGAFVEITPGKDGLVHVSEMSTGYVGKPEDVVSEGQMVHVRVKSVDSEGKISLSMLFGEDIKNQSQDRSKFIPRNRSSRGGFGKSLGFDRGRGSFGRTRAFGSEAQARRDRFRNRPFASTQGRRGKFDRVQRDRRGSGGGFDR